MKVLIVSEPGMDGVFRCVEELIDFALSEGVQVHFAYSDRRAGERLPRLVERVRAAGGETLNLKVGNGPGPGDLPALLALRRLALRVQPDLIDSHSSKAGALARALRFLGVRTPQVYHPHAYAGMRPNRGRAELLYDFVEFILARVSTTVACSYDECGYAHDRLRLSWYRAVCVPHGIDFARFRPASPAVKARLRRKFGLPQNRLVLGSLGRTAAQKDPTTLCEAFARSGAGRDDGKGPVLFHLGKGPMDEALDLRAAQPDLRGRVIRHAYLDTPAEFHQAIDGFFLPSRYEGFSIAVLEAMACNLPLILSDGPGNAQMTQLPLSHCRSAAVGDVEAFAQAIDQWAAEPAPRPNHREVASMRFENQFNYRRTLAVYRRLATRGVREPGPPVATAATPGG